MMHYLISVYGKVQGVFFRANTVQIAQSLGVNGWVKNQKDGSVLISAEGNSQQLSELLAWCHQGPPWSVVEKVEYREIEPEGHRSFQLKY